MGIKSEDAYAAAARRLIGTNKRRRGSPLAGRRLSRLRALVAALDAFEPMCADEYRLSCMPPYDTLAAFGALLAHAMREFSLMYRACPEVASAMRGTAAGKRVLARMKAGEGLTRGPARRMPPQVAKAVDEVLSRAFGPGEDAGESAPVRRPPEDGGSPGSGA